MTHDNDYVIDLSSAKIINAAFDHRAVAEGKQCGDVFHAAKITTKTRRHKVLLSVLCVSVSLWLIRATAQLLRRRFPEFYPVAFRIHGPTEFAEFGFVSFRVHFYAFCPKLGQ